MSKKAKPIEAARKAIEEDRAARMKECERLVNEALERTGCTLAPEVVVLAGQAPQVGVKIVAVR